MALIERMSNDKSDLRFIQKYISSLNLEVKFLFYSNASIVV